eukprot:TRINITY_DN1419_c0_g2_i2.p1 TRINITY_DN1419_c0_g2~~TRINITY_DN1419_c0_g2_i2.p1  ORF type:complete len:203 (+),score=21.40 TRINITY_DN1419_c0_g2_i2:23-610(+)
MSLRPIPSLATIFVLVAVGLVGAGLIVNKWAYGEVKVTGITLADNTFGLFKVDVCPVLVTSCDSVNYKDASKQLGSALAASYAKGGYFAFAFVIAGLVFLALSFVGGLAQSLNKKVYFSHHNELFLCLSLAGLGALVLAAAWACWLGIPDRTSGVKVSVSFWLTAAGNLAAALASVMLLVAYLKSSKRAKYTIFK